MIEKLRRLDLVQRIVLLLIGIGLFVAGVTSAGSEFELLILTAGLTLFMFCWLTFFLHFAPSPKKRAPKA